VIITTGGVSVGDYDFVRPCSFDAGFEQIFWKVKQNQVNHFSSPNILKMSIAVFYLDCLEIQLQFMFACKSMARFY
jgi:hypothetical protein